MLQMESSAPFLITLTVVAAVADDTLLEPFSESEQPSTTPDPLDKNSKLVMGFVNKQGEHKTVELCVHDIERANLSSLTKWLEYTDQLKTMLLKMKDNPEEGHLHTEGEISRDGTTRPYEAPLPEKIDKTLELVEQFEKKIESELRKPEKDWNYSVEKGNENIR